MDETARQRVMNAITEKHRKTRSQRLAELERDIRATIERVTSELRGLLFRVEAMRQECAPDDTTVRLPALPPKDGA